MDFKVTHRTGAHARYADDDNKGFLNLGPFALFNKYRLTSGSWTEIEETDNAHVICLLYNLVSSSRDSDEYQLVFTEVLKLEKKMTNIETTKGNYQVVIHLKDVFGVAEQQEKCTFGLG